MSQFNLFTQRAVPPAFKDLKYNIPFTPTDKDSPYYAEFSFAKNDPYPLSADPMIDPPETNTMYAYIAKDSSQNETELAFLKGVCMVAEREEGFYIHPIASQLYDSQEGIFSFITNENGRSNMNTSTLEKLMNLFLRFILPGLYWQAYHAIRRPVAPIYNNSELIKYMIGVEELWLNINTRFFRTP